MLSFHPLAIEDKQWIDERVFAFNSRSADFNFGSMFMWDGKYRQLVCDCGGRLIVLAHAGEAPIYPFPAGDGDLKTAVTEMRLYADAQGFPLVIRGVEEPQVSELDLLFPGEFSFTEDTEYADYVYQTEKLASLAGKKLHAKRNFINRFVASHDWRFERLDLRHFPDCARLLESWDEGRLVSDPAGVEEEHRAIFRAFEYYDELKLIGGALYAEDKLIAFTMGEKICSDTMDVHFEKASAGIDGAYPMINREFSRLVSEAMPEITYLNREDDMGYENLRTAKQSYHPEFMVRKFTARHVI